MIGRVNMKKLICIILFAILLCGCSQPQNFDIVATTLPVYTFTQKLCDGTGITVGQLVTENISCLHDYTLKVSQMQMLEQADAVVISGEFTKSQIKTQQKTQNSLIFDATVQSRRR